MKKYLLLADKRGYGRAGDIVNLTDRQAEFLLLTQAIQAVDEPGGAGPPAPDAVTGTDGDGRKRRTTVAPVAG